MLCAAFAAVVILVSSFVKREDEQNSVDAAYEDMSLMDVVKDTLDLSAAEVYLEEKMPVIRGLIEELTTNLKEPSASVGQFIRQAAESGIVSDIYVPQSVYPKVTFSLDEDDGAVHCDLEFGGMAFSFTAEAMQEP